MTTTKTKEWPKDASLDYLRLLNCPFCGARAKIETDGDEVIVCSNMNCRVHPYTDVGLTFDEAVFAWNVRYVG